LNFLRKKNPKKTGAAGIPVFPLWSLFLCVKIYPPVTDCKEEIIESERRDSNKDISIRSNLLFLKMLSGRNMRIQVFLRQLQVPSNERKKITQINKEAKEKNKKRKWNHRAILTAKCYQ